MEHLQKPIRRADLVKGGYTIKQGEIFTLGFQLFDSDGSIITPTVDQVISVKMANITGVIYETTASVVENHIEFTVSENIGYGQINVELKVTEGNTLIQKYPADDFIKLKITKSLDDTGVGNIYSVTAEDMFARIEESELTAAQALVASENAEVIAGNAEVIAEAVRTDFDLVVAEAGSSNPEVVLARGGEADLKTRLDKTTLQVAEKVEKVNGVLPDINGNVTITIPQVDTSNLATKTELSNVLDGTPKGTYATLTALQTAFPTGTTGVYIVTADGHIYSWSGSAWVDRGLYQAVKLSDSGVAYNNLDANIKDFIKTSTSTKGITLSDITTQEGQTTSLTYDNSDLVISSSGFGGGMPIFDTTGQSKFEFIVGNATTELSFIPIFAVQKNVMHNGAEVTKYLTFRSTSTNFVIKETYIKNLDATQVYNTDIVSVANPTAKVFATGDKVTVAFEDGLIKLYINNLFILEYDMVTNNSAYVFYGGAWLSGFLGDVAKVAYSDVVLYNSGIGKVNNDIIGLRKEMLKLTDKPRKLAHFSFDDVILVFQDLTTNSANYTSVFQNPFLGYLKQVFDTYGTTFSLYCFYTDSTVGSFTLSDCTNKFASELKANSHWLKFGVHGYDGSMNYSNTTAEKAASDYSLIVTQLVRITGGIDSIDRLPRLSNFLGNTESLVAMRDSKCGIVGVLTSMDVRANYNLTTAQNNYIYTHDKLYDANTYLTYIKTTGFGTDLNQMNTLDGANERNILESFLHENQLSAGYKLTLESFCAWAIANGYTFGFPMNLTLN